MCVGWACVWLVSHENAGTPMVGGPLRPVLRRGMRNLHVAAATIGGAMGQPVTVLEKPSSRAGVVRFEINRTLTGMGHERYRAGQVVEGDRPPDELARRLFERGGIDAVHINSNVITLDLDKGADTDGIVGIIEDLYTYYRPGVPVPDPADFGAAAE